MKLVTLFAINEAQPGQATPGSVKPPGTQEPPAAGPQIMGLGSNQQSSGQGTRVTGDAATLGALENILSDVRDESMIDWADEARDAIAAAIRKGGDQITATLPKFVASEPDDEGDME